MHSQSSDTLKVACVESQAKSSTANNNLPSKSMNNHAMTKRKQNSNLIHQMKSSSTTDLTIGNVQHKLAGTSTMSENPLTNHLNNTQSKSQQIHTGRQLQRRSVVQRVSPNNNNNNGRTEIGNDQILGYQNYQGQGYHTPSPGTVQISMSSPHIGTHHYHNQYSNYPNPVQIQQSQTQPFHSDGGNRYNYNRHNSSNGKKNYNSNYSKSKRNGNFSSSSSTDKAYNSSSNNNNNNNNNNYSKNNNNNNEFERNTANKSGSHIGQPITRNGHRSYNSDTSKNISPSRDNHYSSSSSSSSSSSVPLNKKSMQLAFHCQFINQFFSFHQLSFTQEIQGRPQQHQLAASMVVV